VARYEIKKQETVSKDLESEKELNRREAKEYHCSCDEIGLLSENVKIKTRPEEQPIDTTVPDIAEDDGRHSGGSHSRFSPWYVIQVPVLLRPYPTAIGDN
jgi:hypothetical protein